VLLATARFTKEGMRRRFSIKISLAEKVAIDAERSVSALRKSQSNGLSEIRFAVTEGKIASASGFTIAEDKQSALLEPRQILESLKQQAEVEAFLEWIVSKE
jgi:hypothetical protein